MNHSKIIFFYSAWLWSLITGTVKVGEFIESKILVYFTSTKTSLECYSLLAWFGTVSKVVI